jgi:glutathione peroxidase
MRKFLLACLAIVASVGAPHVRAAQPGCPDTLDFDVKPLAGVETVNLCREYKGKVVLVVNTASKCGFTPQYDGLEALYSRYRDRGLVVIGFPSNDFGQQEPGSEKQIKDFCRLTYGVKFPMYQKAQVRADNADPLYRTLAQYAQEYPQWNFHKYLLDRDGKLAASFKSEVEPESRAVVTAIEALL